MESNDAGGRGNKDLTREQSVQKAKVRIRDLSAEIIHFTPWPTICFCLWGAVLPRNCITEDTCGTSPPMPGLVTITGIWGSSELWRKWQRPTAAQSRSHLSPWLGGKIWMFFLISSFWDFTPRASETYQIVGDLYFSVLGPFIHG